jgi:hypothetical protein
MICGICLVKKSSFFNSNDFISKLLTNTTLFLSTLEKFSWYHFHHSNQNLLSPQALILLLSNPMILLLACAICDSVAVVLPHETIPCCNVSILVSNIASLSKACIILILSALI